MYPGLAALHVPAGSDPLQRLRLVPSLPSRVMILSRPQPNLDLIDRVLQQIDAEPERWSQTWWRDDRPDCGSAYCFGGWAVALSGGVWTDDGYMDTVVPEPGDACYPKADYTFVEERATRVLGLTDREATRLFDAMNSREDLQEIVEELRARTAA